jgi:hypothetical protein
MKVFHSGARCRVVAKCMPPDINIEKKRAALRHGFYSIQRPISSAEMNMILTPLFQDVNLEVGMMKNKIVIHIGNTKSEDDVTEMVLDLINEWGVHDEFRRFIVKSFSNANKKGIYRYKKDMEWKCPLNIHYVFAEEEPGDGLLEI